MSTPPRLIGRRNLDPGGYIQQIEIEIVARCDDDTFTEDSYFHELDAIAQRFNTTTGKDFTIANQMKHNIQEAGFVDVVQRRYKLPLGAWSSNRLYREVGKWFEAYWRTGMQGWLMAPLTRFEGVRRPARLDLPSS